MFQPLREQAQPCLILEYDLDEIGLATPEDEEVAGERVLPQHLLNKQGQPIHSLAHICVAIRQVHLHAGRQQGHCDTSPSTDLDIDEARRCCLLLSPPAQHASGDAIASRDLGYAGVGLGYLSEDVTPVDLAEPPPMARSCRGNDRTRRRLRSGISHVTKGVT